MADWMFDKRGRPCLILDGNQVRSRRGAVVGWIEGGSVHSLRGAHIGWFEGGVIYDSRNSALAFARRHSAHLPSEPGLSAEPAMPGFSGVPGRPGLPVRRDDLVEAAGPPRIRRSTFKADVGLVTTHRETLGDPNVEAR